MVKAMMMIDTLNDCLRLRLGSTGGIRKLSGISFVPDCSVIAGEKLHLYGNIVIGALASIGRHDASQ